METHTIEINGAKQLYTKDSPDGLAPNTMLQKGYS
jgi:hypothetical protein